MPRRTLLLGCQLMLFAGVIAGCLADFEEEEGEPVAPGPFLVDFKIIDIQDGEAKSAGPGHHCESARIDDGTLNLGLWPGENRSDGPWIAVFPQIPAHWHTSIDGESYKTSLPVTLDPAVEDDPTTLGELEWVAHGSDGNGTLHLDEEPLTLPHSWEITGEDGSWRAEATVDRWDQGVEFERFTGLCD